MKLRWVQRDIWMRDSDGNERRLSPVLQVLFVEHIPVGMDEVQIIEEWRDVPIESE